MTKYAICGTIHKKGGLPIKHIAELITFSRIPMAAGLVLTAPFSTAFWVLYCLCGASDAIDGAVARKLGIQSERGALLDSIADMVFFAAVIFVAAINFEIPTWLIVGTAIVSAIRLSSCGLGLYRFHTLPLLHTYANKAAGLVLFAFLGLGRLLGVAAAGAIALAFTSLSSIEELIIVSRTKELHRNVRGLWLKKADKVEIP
ncbi:MAG: CDP-alcohol phosphatidyltransferase family protein [Clostridia bacterium]|nr:CDP-alcohol phosphatidyltransferase family protein [Clostridia bacterium]